MTDKSGGSNKAVRVISAFDPGLVFKTTDKAEKPLIKSSLKKRVNNHFFDKFVKLCIRHLKKKSIKLILDQEVLD
jgi:hypothetical protein